MRASAPSPSMSTSTSMRPCGCSTESLRTPATEVGPLATVPGSAKAVATPMAPVTACEAWQRRGVK